MKQQAEEEGTAGLAKGSGSMDQSQVQQLAGELFTLFDTDKSGQLTSRQFKRGLIALGVYIKKKDFLGLVHVIDVDQSGWISLEQWEAFLATTDEELDAELQAYTERLYKVMKGGGKIVWQPRDQALLFVMLGLLMLYGYITSLIGSHLLGAFIAGMSFCQLPAATEVWHDQALCLLL